MQKETFEVTLTDDQLKAAKDAAQRAGVNLSESGSQSRDGVTISYKVTSKENGQGPSDNLITVDVLHRPFYVPLDEVQKAITDFLTNPPPPPGDAGESEPPARTDKTTAGGPQAVAAKTATKPAEPEHHAKRNL